MNTNLRRTVTVLLGLSLGIGLSLSASAQDAALSGVAVRVNPGKMDEYLSRVKKLQGVMDRLDGRRS